MPSARHLPQLVSRDAGFVWRGGESVTRLEGFSDAVFGFAITLLVLSLEVPRTSAELLQLLQGLPAFAASFAVLTVIWYSHCLFFRRYGLQDGITIALNALLLFVVLCYVYPLKFLFTLLTSLVTGWGAGDAIVAPAHSVLIMVTYAIGLVAVFGILWLMYARAHALRDALELTPRERHLTVTTMQYLAIYCAVGLCSALIATLGGRSAVPIAGLSFMLLGPFCGLHGWRRGRTMPPIETRPSGPSDVQEVP